MLKLASVLGSSQPSPDGVHREETWRPENRYLWNWNDTQGDGQIEYAPRTTTGQAGEVTLVGLPGVPDANWYWFRRAFEVDHAGWLWMASANRNRIPEASYPFEGEALYAIAPQGLNALGNPIYTWSDAVKVMDADTGRNALALAGEEAFEWKMAGRSDEGMVYALAWSEQSRPFTRWRCVDGRECALWLSAIGFPDACSIGNSEMAGSSAEKMCRHGAHSRWFGRCARGH